MNRKFYASYMQRKLIDSLPPAIKWPIKWVIYRGNLRYCPVCDSHVRLFLATGYIRRENACCPVCWSFERHRFIWRFFERKTNLFDGKPKKMLHIAPEYGIQTRLSRIPTLDYITADLLNPHVKMQMDITDIHLPDNSFDVVYCSHVLEHVNDDRKAMRELHRVLKPDGWAVIVVPISVNATVEDPTITDPQERLRLFGQEDHVRRYGLDVINRLKEAGFNVQQVSAEELLSPIELEEIAAAGESLFYCTK